MEQVLSEQARAAIRSEVESRLTDEEIGTLMEPHLQARLATERVAWEAAWETRLNEAIARERAERNAPPAPAAPDLLDAEAIEPRLPDPIARIWNMALLESYVRGHRNVKATSFARRTPKALGMAMEFMERQERALDTETQYAGAEWVPTAFAQQMIVGVDYATRVASLFPDIPMPAKTLTVPTETPEDVATYFVAENVDLTAYNTLIADSGPVTNNIELSAKKIGARVILSNEFEEDAAPVCLARAMRKIELGLARGIDDAILNGDTASPHMDEDITSAADRRKAFLGLRALAYDNSTVASLATFTADDFITLRGMTGEYGLDLENCVWIAGPHGVNLLTLLRDVNDQLVMTRVSDAGPQATILRGTVGSLFNCPVVFCPKTREDVDADGYWNTGDAHDKGTLLYVWRPAWAKGLRRAPRLERATHIGAQAVEIVTTVRMDFKHGLGTEDTTALGYNF